MASRRAETIAIARARRLERYEMVGIRAARRILIGLYDSILKAYRDGRSSDERIDESMDALSRLLADGSAVGHISGLVDGIADGSAALAKREQRRRSLRTVPNDAYRNAMTMLTKRAKLNPAQTAQIVEEYGKRSVNMVGGYGAAFRRDLDGAMFEMVQQGVHVREGSERLAEVMSSHGISPGSKNHVAKTLFRTNLNLAYSAGHEIADSDPDIQEILWGYEYTAILDDRVRPTHRALDGTKLRKDDPRWVSITPPNGYNCRCTRIAIYDEEPKEKDHPADVKIGGQRIPVQPDEGWSFNPASLMSSLAGIGARVAIVSA